MFIKKNYKVTQQLESNGLITKYILKARSKKLITKYYQVSEFKKGVLLLSIERTNKKGITTLYKKPFRSFKALMHLYI